MQEFIDKEVQQFLKDILISDNKKFDIIQELRRNVFENFENIDESFKYGGIIFILKNTQVGGIFCYKKHVTFEFSNGYLFNDSHNILQGKGKYRRNIKVEVIDDILKKEIDFFIKQLGLS